MKVLGIDPGYDRLGLAVLEKSNGIESLIYSKCIESDRKMPVAKRIGILGKELNAIITEYRPDAVAIETIFFNQNRSTAVAVAEMRGVALYLAEQHQCQIMEFGPQEVKVAVTGHGASDKRAVMAMLGRLINNLPERALDDEYDAIAVALTALAHQAHYDKIHLQ